MKYSRTDVHCKTHKIPAMRFEDQRLTSFSGLVLFQSLFVRLDLKERLRSCFNHITGGAIVGHAAIVFQLVVHLLLGYRELRDSRYYRDDPMVKRLLGLRRLPDVARSVVPWPMPTRRVWNDCATSVGNWSWSGCRSWDFIV